MDTLITYDEVAALIAHPPSIAPHSNFYKFAQLEATHPTRFAAHKLPPEQHTGMGGIDHVKRNVCSPNAYTISDPK